ncbi:tail protein [Bacillus phage vB_BceH_LY2]|nr:tail protein [Bacillus phage vB_BceH_LY2]
MPIEYKDDNTGASIFVPTEEERLALAKQKEIITLTDTIKETSKQGITCNALGLTPNDLSSANDNTEKLINAINTNHKILLDNSYFINTSNIEINAQLDILGVSTNAELKLIRHISSSTIFRVSGMYNVNIEKIKITNDSSDVIQLLSTATTTGNWYMNKFNFSGNTVIGSIGVIYAFSDNTVNPIINKMGFGEFVFHQNTLRGIDKVSCVNLFDTPGTQFTLSSNTVTNFSNNFFNLTITNGKPYERYFFDAIKTLIVRENIVTCEDAFWGNNTGGYYTFVLFEGDKCIFENNTIEGMKSKQSNLSLYDSYLSCNVVEYRNNTIKNNVLFLPNKTENTLIKSKEGSFADKLGTRVYEGNRYIVEKSFIERHGLLTEGWIYMLDLTSQMKEYKLVNNEFDVYELRMMSSTNRQRFGNVTFTDNSIKCEIASQIMFNINLDNNETRTIRFKNNNIRVNSGTFTLFRTEQQADYRVDNVIIENNTIIGNGSFCSSCYFKETLINNNVVVCNADTILLYLGDLGEVTKLNNMFKLADSTKKLTMSRSNRSFNNTIENNTYLLRMDNNNSQGIQLPKVDKQNKKITYYVSMDVNYIDGTQSTDYSFSYGYDSVGDYNYIEYLDTSGVLQKVNVSTGSTSIEMKTNNKTSVTRAKIHIVFNSEGVNIRPTSGVTYTTPVTQKISTVIQ